MQKSQKSPIKPTKKSMQILKVLGKSEKPLSSRDIEKKLLGPEKVKNGKRDPDVYRAIEHELCIRKFKYGFFIFDWNELSSSLNERGEETTPKKRIQSKVINNLNKIGLDLVDYNYDKVKFSKENHDSSVITVAAPRRSNPNISRLIKIHKESEDNAALTVFDNGKKVRMPTSLTIKKVGKKEQQLFYQGIKGNPVKEGISYLKVFLNERAGKMVEGIKSMNPDLFNCTDKVKTIARKCLLSNKIDDMAIISAASEIESNRRNLEYGINIRGLVLYILGIINEGRARNIEISKVLQNLSENYKEEFPFLVHYKEIKELYDKLATEKGILEYEYFQVQLLKQIALELQYSLDTTDKEGLIYYITKRCSEELTWYYMAPLKISPSPLPKVIREYYIYTQRKIRNYLEKELQDTRSRIEYAISKS